LSFAQSRLSPIFSFRHNHIGASERKITMPKFMIKANSAIEFGFGRNVITALLCVFTLALTTFALANSKTNRRSVAAAQPLISAAPVVLNATFLGGPGYDRAWTARVDGSGNVYVVGDTQEAGLAVTNNAFQKTFGGGGQDGFVSKFDKNGNLLWSTLLGGSGWDGIYAVAVDASGNAVVTGVTQSPDFPVTSNAVQDTFPGGSAAFVTVVTSDGSGITYSTYLGGSQSDGVPLPTNPYGALPKSDVASLAIGVTIGADGSLYVAGETNTVDMPVTSGAAQSLIGGDTDGFVARIRTDIAGPAGLIYLTYLGGASFDLCSAVAVDAAGNAFVTGQAQSLNFPTTTGSFQSVHTLGTAAFIAKLASDGSRFIYSTLLGGTQSGSAGSGNNYTASQAIAVDSNGHAYVAGSTSDTDFPTTPGVIQPANNGIDDGFVSELAADGSSLVFSTYLGGSDYDGLFGLRLDAAGNILVSGFTASRDLPQVGAFQATFGGYIDCWIAKLSPGGTTLLLSSYFGGSDQELAYGVDFWNDEIYFAGTTTSTDFPVASTALQTLYGGGAGDAFLTVVDLASSPVQLVGAISRQVHGLAGTFDVDLPLSGSPGIECRSGGATGDYTLVFTFADQLSSVGVANVTAGTGSVSNSNIDDNDAHNYIVNLTGITNAQIITVSLANLTDAAGNFSSSISMQLGVLVGDVDGNGGVSGSDVNSCKAQVGAELTTNNFRADVNADGNVTGSDVNTIKTQVGALLPFDQGTGPASPRRSAAKH
jgi:dockerin type I repeat protein/beta-propeller repeat-containing protein